MAHRAGDSAAEPELRAYLLADRVAFRHDMCVTLAENPSWSATAWAQLSPPVDALAAGQRYRLHRWELPDSHPQRFVGSGSRRSGARRRVAPRVDAGQELIAPGAAPLRNLRNTCPQQVSPSQIAQLFNAMAS